MCKMLSSLAKLSRSPNYGQKSEANVKLQQQKKVQAKFHFGHFSPIYLTKDNCLAIHLLSTFWKVSENWLSRRAPKFNFHRNYCYNPIWR